MLEACGIYTYRLHCHTDAVYHSLLRLGSSELPRIGLQISKFAQKLGNISVTLPRTEQTFCTTTTSLHHNPVC